MEELDFSGIEEYLPKEQNATIATDVEELDFSGIEEYLPKFDGRKSESGIPLMSGENMPDAESEKSISDMAIGAGEAGLTTATGITGGAAGHISGFLSGLYEEIKSGNFGTEEAANRIKKKSEELASSMTYSPKTEAGQEYTKSIGESLQALEPLTPMAGELSAVSRAVSSSLPIPIKAPKVVKTDAALMEATKRGIPVLKSDVTPPRTFVQKTAQQIAERVPFAGTGGIRGKQQTARINAIKNFVSEYGDDVVKENFNEVSTALNTARSNKINRFVKLKGDVIERLSGKEIQANKTISEIDAQVAALNKIGTESSVAAASKLEGYKNAFTGKDLKGIESVRKDLGEVFKSPDMVSSRSAGEKAVSSIYGALKQDMGDFIKANGDAKDFNKWRVADKELSSMMGELKSTTLKNVLKKGNLEPEAVDRLLFSSKPSEIRTLYKNLDAKGKQTAKVAILNRAIKNSGGIDEISPAKFKSQLDKLSKSVGVFFEGKDRDLINGLGEALSLTKRADEFAVSPPTGVQNTMMFGGMAATDMLGSMGAATASMGAAGLIARMYETIPIKMALKRLGKAKKGTPEYNSAVENLMKVMYTTKTEREAEKE